VREKVAPQTAGCAKAFIAERTGVAVLHLDFEVDAARMHAQVGPVLERLSAQLTLKGWLLEMRHHMVLQQTLVDEVKAAEVTAVASLRLKVGASVLQKSAHVFATNVAHLIDWAVCGVRLFVRGQPVRTQFVACGEHDPALSALPSANRAERQ